MTYTKQTWLNSSVGNTPVNALRLNHMEDGIESAAIEADIANLRAFTTDAFIDFTTKTNGDPPSILDTGQVVDFLLQDVNGWKPQINGGKLIHGNVSPATTGNYADYIQAQIDGDVRAAGTQFTVDSSDGSTTNGSACLAVWASVFEAAGTIVPKTPCHFTVDMIGGAWAYWVSDGGGTGSSHLKAVKTGTFTPPASDGTTIWEMLAYIDPDNGVVYASLPGVDALTGSRWVSVTDTEIAASLTAQSVPVTTLAACLSGADVLMVEHFANTNANTARYPRFLNMWGNVRRPARDAARLAQLKALVPDFSNVVRYHPNPTETKTPTASMTAVDSTNVKLVGKAGPTGRILFEINCYYEFTGTDVVLMRLRNTADSSMNTASEVVCNGVSGDKKAISPRIEKSGLIPGQTAKWELHHQCQNSAVVMKTGGSGGFSTLPAIYVKATPI